MGEVIEITEDMVHMKVGETERAFFPRAVLATKDAKNLKIGSRVFVRIKKKAPDDTGEWHLRVLSPSQYVLGRGEIPTMKERVPRPKR